MKLKPKILMITSSSVSVDYKPYRRVRARIVNIVLAIEKLKTPGGK